RKEERSLVINPSAIPGQPTGPTSSIMSFNPPISIRTLVGHCTSPAHQLRDHAGQPFATQGIKITIRKDFRYQKTSNDELQDDESSLNQTNVTPDNHKDESSDTDSIQEIIKQIV
ncbi:15707_t:CDS:2, partial [Racocetra fulgida]